MKCQKGLCALTLEECELRQSHLFPSFFWKYLKETGGEKFRSTNNPTEVLQDGEKCYLLGHQAEQMFAAREKWFAEIIFRPFCNGLLAHSKVIYDERLYYFIVSLMWRIFYCSKDYIINPRLKERCLIALEEWRIFLLEGIIPPTFSRVYMMPVTPDIFFSPSLQISPDLIIPYNYYKDSKGEFYEINYYLLRDFDREIFCDLPNNRALYCKAPRFIFWADLERDDHNLNYGMRIAPEGGKLDFKRYNIGTGEIKTFILRRIINVIQEYEKAKSKISEKAQDKILKRMLKNPSLKGSEVAQLIIERAMAET